MDKRLHHYNSDGQEIVLSGQRKSNEQVKSNYQRMLRGWRKAVGQPPVKVENGNLNAFR